MRTFTLELKKDGVPTEVNMRLTIAGQLALKKKYSNENALTTIFGGLDDLNKMLDVFTQALTFKGNTNEVKDGAELYDLIVDNDLGGVAGFQRILSGIARESGLLTDSEKAAIDKRAEGILDDDPNA